jgi:hypothetical protein
LTILIAIALHDTVVMMADGRRSNRLAVITDRAEKLTLLHKKLVLAVGGAEIGTEMAEEELRRNAATSATTLRSQLANVAFGCASHVMSLITPETYAQANVKVGLFTGGFDAQGCFLAAGLYGTGMQEPDSLLVRPSADAPQFIVHGGEGVGAQEHFKQGMVDLLPFLGSSNPDRLAVGRLLVGAAEKTVRFAAQRDPTVGGRIQYRVLHNLGLGEAGFL